MATENLPDDIDALKRIIADLSRDAVVAQAEIAKLKFQLARYRRGEFGRSSEKLARDIAPSERAWHLQQDAIRILVRRNASVERVGCRLHRLAPGGPLPRPADRLEDPVREKVEQLVAIPDMPIQRRRLDLKAIGESPHGEAFQAHLVDQLEGR